MKKAITMVLAAAMCMSMAVRAMANGIQPRAPRCNECGGMTYWHEETKKIETMKSHGDHRDLIIRIEDREGYKCSSCGEYDYNVVHSNTETECPYNG